jgi:hypothetical protein
MAEGEAIEKAKKMALDLVNHCKENDLMEGIFYGVVVDGPNFETALIKRYDGMLREQLERVLGGNAESRAEKGIVLPGEH